jgi:hypothetical protein
MVRLKPPRKFVKINDWTCIKSLRSVFGSRWQKVSVKNGFSYRLERVGGECFLAVTAISNNLVYRLDFASSRAAVWVSVLGARNLAFCFFCPIWSAYSPPVLHLLRLADGAEDTLAWISELVNSNIN